MSVSSYGRSAARPRHAFRAAARVALAAAATSLGAGASRAQTLPADVQPCPQPAPPEPQYVPKPASAPFLVQAFGPNPPAYPYFAGRGRDGLISDAQCISNALERYVKAWLDGRVPAQIPAAFLPRGYDPNELQSFTLVRPGDVSPDDQWLRLPAGPIGADGTSRAATSDPHNAYLSTPVYAPFGSSVLVEGDFPYARFFNMQVSPPFDPLNYRINAFGAPEVPINDVDINPDWFSVNPFRAGADRNWFIRHYHLTFRMAAGDAVGLNGTAFVEPTYRGAGNTRYGSGIQYRGPWGASSRERGDGRGIWDVGRIFVRAYYVDKNALPLGGVSLPKVTYQLPDGRQYYIKIVQSQKEIPPIVVPRSDPVEPDAANATAGWGKQTDILAQSYGGFVSAFGFTGPDASQYLRDISRGAAGRDLTFAGPQGYEASNTTASPVNYFVRGMSLGAGKVVVLTGRLPTTPKTFQGNRTLTPAQARYWSITGYAVPTAEETVRALLLNDPVASAIATTAVHSVADEEITADPQQRFVIVMSRPEDRPANATAANGVTWVNWGVRGSVYWVWRWMSVTPDWVFAKSPISTVLPGARTTGYSATYDPSLIGTNDQSGPLGDYIPRVSYLTRSQFEALGAAVTPDRVPVWR